MQSELLIGNSRAKSLSNLVIGAQQRRQASKQPRAQRVDSGVTPKQQTRGVKPAVVLPNYKYGTLYPQRRVSYIWANTEFNSQRLGWGMEALQRLARSSVLGFDMEWRPTFVKGQPANPVALIQLAGENDIALVHVHLLRRIPQIVQDILRNPDILKVGVGIRDDAKKFEKDWQVEVANVLDLSELARQVDPLWDKMDQQRREEQEAAREKVRLEQVAKEILANADRPLSNEELQKLVDEKEVLRAMSKPPHTPKTKSTFGLISLARLTAEYLSMKLVKGATSRSNWEHSLNENQVTYAANDAAVAYDIHQRLQAIGN